MHVSVRERLHMGCGRDQLGVPCKKKSEEPHSKSSERVEKVCMILVAALGCCSRAASAKAAHRTYDKDKKKLALNGPSSQELLDLIMQLLAVTILFCP